ncbi:zinc ribbon domain-containing protein [bacterium]|nr:zinc ribbon domain-containing protein [bacterium]
MPTYEYECKECGHRFEIRQDMKDKPMETCPECKGKVKRLLGATHAIIKGAGQRVSNEPAIQCGRETTCCGRQVPCSERPCDK